MYILCFILKAAKFSKSNTQNNDHITKNECVYLYL